MSTEVENAQIEELKSKLTSAQNEIEQLTAAVCFLQMEKMREVKMQLAFDDEPGFFSAQDFFDFRNQYNAKNPIRCIPD